MSAAPSEEYPTREDLVRAGLIAAGTALLGFLVSYHIFVHPLHQGVRVAGLDRRAAEHPLPPAYHGENAGSPRIDFAYSSGVSDSGTGDKRRRLVIAEPTRTLPAVAVATPTPEATPSALPLPDEQYQTAGHARQQFHLRDPRTQAQQEQASANLPPPRPEPVSYAQAWQRVQTSIMQFGDAIRVSGQGVLVAPGLVVTTMSTFRSSGGRGMLAGSAVTSHLVAGDSAHDLALVQLDGADGVPVPLCPDSSLAGDLLITADGVGGGFAELRSRGSAGEWVGFYGWNSAQMGGAPLVNNRGELVGLSLPRPSVDSLSWNLAVPASTLQTFLTARPSPGGAAFDASSAWAKALRTRIAPLNERTPPNRANGRVIPGVAMGNYPLGMTLEQLRGELGNGTVLERRPGLLRLQYPLPRLTFTLAEDVVVQIETDYSFYTMESGWSVGSHVDDQQIRTRLPEAVLHQRDRFNAACSAGLELVLTGDTISLLRVTAP